MSQGKPRAGEFYLHFKNKLYQVLSVAKHTETGELLVVYQALYGDYGVYARPYSMFISEVDHEKYPEVLNTYRFTLVDPEAMQQAVTQDGSLSIASLMRKPEHRSGTLPDLEPLDLGAKKDTEEHVSSSLLDFLDEEDFSKKYKILERMYEEKELDDTMIDNLAASIDVVIPDGDLDSRYEHLKYAVSTRMKFETDRLRR
ncbi:MAG TPA: DUF1653 domain-containing protein [Lachnospiraceae bacterium]|nr:DUF1653 domain-containing protein [Lachnospiraceae bacterium]